MSCPCEKPKCSGSNPNPALEIVKDCDPILFHKVLYPASLGDDTTVNVNELDYRNVLLTFEANNHSYLYSSDGIPTFISLGDISTEAVEAAIKELQQDLANETLNRADADDNLQEQVTANANEIVGIKNDTAEAISELQADVADNTESIQANATKITNLEDSIETLDTKVTNLDNVDVVKDLTVSGDNSTVTITKERSALGSSDTTGTNIPFPVADSTQAGVMNPATYNAVQENAENIDSILGGAVVVQALPADPTNEQLTTAWKAATGKTELINRASIYDETNNKVWYYYENANAWKPISTDGTEVTVSIATNDTTGIVKGSTEDGQVAVEADGSMSLNGYDGMQHDIENLSQLVAGIEVPKLPAGMVYDFVSPAGANNPSTADNANITARVVNTTTGNVTNATLMMPMASDTQAGSVTAADKSKLDSLLEIKSLNDSLELDENGQLSVVGGGQDINVLSNYTATVGSNDVYSATYVNGKLDGGAVALGREATISGEAAGGIAIGFGATAASSPFDAAVAIGGKHGALAGATAIHSYSVAVGTDSKTSRSSEFSVGGGSTVRSRYLANVKAGTLPADAVNLKQMQDYVAENAGNPFTEMETTRVQNLPPAVVTGFEDTAYGTDTITMHLDTKDLATGGVSVQELELEGATANTDEVGGHAGLMTAFQATQLAALAAGGAGGLTPDEVTKVQNLGTGSLTNMDGVLQTEEAVEIEFSRQNLVAGGSTTQTATIAAATTEEAGVMTPSMVVQLNQIGDIATVLETITTGTGV